MTYGGCGMILVGEKFAGEHYDLWLIGLILVGEKFAGEHCDL